MLSRIRFSFVVLLVLLQLVAPLIHAHKNDNTNLGSLFHLPEFEQVDALIGKSSQALTAPQFYEGEIVTISAGVKENQREFSFKDKFQQFIAFSFVFFYISQQKTQCRFFKQTEPIRRIRFFNPASSPRAPPIFTV